MRLLILALLLAVSGCATNSLIANPDGTSTSTAGYGQLAGGWDRARNEATSQAVAYCNTRNEVFVFLNEQRDGTPGFTPLKSAITFRCGANVGLLIKDASLVCEKEVKAAGLSLISDKVELTRNAEATVPFEIASNRGFPTEPERQQIAKWASLRDTCSKRYEDILKANPPTGNQLQITNANKDRSFILLLTSKVSELIVALYQGRISYGEFSQKRAEISRDIVAAQRDFQSANLMADRDLQIKNQQLAEQRMANSIAAWGSYMQSVNARPVVSPNPVTNSNVRLQTNCMSQRIGNMVSTNCN